MQYPKVVFQTVFALALVACNTESGPSGITPPPDPIYGFLTVNDHTDLGQANGTKDAIELKHIELANTSTENLLADVGFKISPQGEAVALSTVDLGTDKQD